MSYTEMIEFRKPERHEKAWGYEDWIINSYEYGYCGKILHFNQGAKFSLHLHRYKHETWYVLKGTLRLNYILTDSATPVFETIKEGDVIVVPPCHPHQLVADTEADILEVSTLHVETDSYRIEKGDSQTAK